MTDNLPERHLPNPPPAQAASSMPPLYPAAPAGLPPLQPPRRRRRPAVIAILAAAALLVVGGASVTAYLMRGDQQQAPPGAGPAGSADPSPSNQELSAEQIYDTSPWPYDDTFDNGNSISGQLELLETYDHPDCVSAAQTDPARQALRTCAQRLEAAYRGTLDGHVISEQVLVFADEVAAEAFLAEFGDTYPGEVISFQDPENIQAEATYTGGWIEAVGRYVVLSVMFSRTDTDLQQGGNDTAARQQETIEFLSARG